MLIAEFRTALPVNVVLTGAQPLVEVTERTGVANTSICLVPKTGPVGDAWNVILYIPALLKVLEGVFKLEVVPSLKSQ
jgi:hypothetical protein